MRRVVIVPIIIVLLIAAYYAGAQQQPATQYPELREVWASVIGQRGDFEPLNDRSIEGFLIHENGKLSVRGVGSDHVVIGHEEGAFIYPLNRIYLYIPER